MSVGHVVEAGVIPGVFERGLDATEAGVLGIPGGGLGASRCARTPLCLKMQSTFFFSGL